MCRRRGLRASRLIDHGGVVSKSKDPAFPHSYLLYLLYRKGGLMDVAIDAGVVAVGADTLQKQGKSTRRRNLTTQVNARIASEIKGRADEAFAMAGIAPSEAIRALYARAAYLGSSLRSVADLVVGMAEDDETQDSREVAFERATHAFDSVLARYGFSVDIEGFAPMTEEEIEEQMYQDYLANGAL